jgi:hypothetical protein
VVWIVAPFFHISFSFSYALPLVQAVSLWLLFCELSPLAFFNHKQYLSNVLLSLSCIMPTCASYI